MGRPCESCPSGSLCPVRLVWVLARVQLQARKVPQVLVLAPAPVTLPIPIPAPAPVQLEPIPLRESSPQSTLVDLPSATIPFPSSCPPLETIHERPEGSEDAPRPQLVRRRSSLKNGNGHCGNGNGRASRLSIVSQTKSVTWAMDRDWVEQMAKYENATREAEVICECLYVFSSC